MDARTDAHDFDDGIPLLSENPYCLWGWSNHDVHYPGGCTCFRELGHAGRCCCDCGLTKKRPKDWDASGRAEANR